MRPAISDELLLVAEATELWEASRSRIRERCEAAAAAMRTEIGRGIDNLGYKDLTLSGSDNLARLGEQLRKMILQLEKALAREITDGIEAEESLRFRRGVLWTSIPSVADDPLSGRGGLSLRDVVGVFAGGGAVAGTVAVGGRAAPAVLTTVGLGVIALPATIVGGVLGVGLTARSLGRKKRRDLHEVLAETIARIVLGEDGAPSVLTNHLNHVDKLYKPLLDLPEA